MKGEVEVTLADKRTLRLVFDANAWIEAEDVLDKPVQDILDEISSGKAGLKTQRAIVFGGLRRHHPEMTLLDAGEVLVEAAQAMAKGIAGSMPKSDEGVGDEADQDPPKRRRPRRAGTGTSS